MRVLVNRRPKRNQPWGGGALFLAALCDGLRDAGHEVVDKLVPDIDVIFMMDPRADELGISVREIAAYKFVCPKTRVLHRVNECDARKGTTKMDELLRGASSVSDATVFVSNWMRRYHLERGWSCVNLDVIYNGVNHEHFRPMQQMNDGKIHLVSHHWSDNPNKGEWVYKWLDDFVSENSGFTYTYIGRTKADLKWSEVISPTYGEHLGRELAIRHVYISGTRFDPGPNHCTEALACGLPTYVHGDGGGAVEFAGEDHSFSDLIELEHLLLSGDYEKNVFVPGTWEECVAKYIDSMEQLR